MFWSCLNPQLGGLLEELRLFQLHRHRLQMMKLSQYLQFSGVLTKRRMKQENRKASAEDNEHNDFVSHKVIVLLDSVLE